MKPPCAKCPFRAKFKGDKDYLRVGRRADIALSILRGSEFPCHETVDYDVEDEDGWPIPDDSKATPCVGLDLVQLRADRAGQMLRIRERLGVTNTAELLHRGRNVKLWTWEEILTEGMPSSGEELDGDCCSVCGPECEAPAGYLFGGEAFASDDTTDNICPTCGEYVCESCMFDRDHPCAYENQVTPIRPRRGAPSIRKEENVTDRTPIGDPPKAQRSWPR
jgi:hypothetical protein